MVKVLLMSVANAELKNEPSTDAGIGVKKGTDLALEITGEKKNYDYESTVDQTFTYSRDSDGMRNKVAKEKVATAVGQVILRNIHGYCRQIMQTPYCKYHNIYFQSKSEPSLVMILVTDNYSLKDISLLVMRTRAIRQFGSVMIEFAL
ncbi:hypothetical protein Cadr_000026811 [Camelus dromedarius]|uniref:Uncharacterized protein n=1 Tax=Camelus dromedarius TaxID=9838 RepID=A0A5N4C6Q4_CAMDR|nr:hypothetical protein Cadr_000026811 [Camelus dromedarius]